MTKDEIIRCAIDALEAIAWSNNTTWQSQRAKIEVDAIKEALAQQDSKDKEQSKTDAFVKQLDEALAQPYPDNFIYALMYDVAKRDSEAQQAYEDAFVNGTGVMLGDKRIDPASIYKEQEPVKLWLWKNFVGGKPEYWAFDNPFPINTDNHDPQTIGEPCGYAWLKPSRQGRFDVSDEDVLRAIQNAKEYPPQRKPLTDEEIETIWQNTSPYYDHQDFARDIEAAHGIKEEA